MCVCVDLPEKNALLITLISIMMIIILNLCSFISSRFKKILIGICGNLKVLNVVLFLLFLGGYCAARCLR